MKKLFIILAAVCMAVSGMAQTYPTKFLGIPIDGSKADMMRKIQAKGYTYNSEFDCLQGEFNGTPVNIYITTNNNKVCRIMVAEQYTCSESDIRIRFNNLMHQFDNHENYLGYNMWQEFIPEDEDISYEMTINNKIYQAEYVQMTHELDNTRLDGDAMLIADHIDQYLPREVIAELDTKSLSKFCVAKAVIMQYENNQVWFRINEYNGEYYLTIFYENMYNKANGEDL